MSGNFPTLFSKKFSLGGMMPANEMFLIFERVLTFNKLFAITDNKEIADSYKLTKGFEVVNFGQKEKKQNGNNCATRYGNQNKQGFYLPCPV